MRPLDIQGWQASRLPDSLEVFCVPAKLIRILDRDLKLAGIPKVDASNRTVHVHGLRDTFGTHLSKTGASPRTAQAAMRHSDIALTMNVYTDPKLLDASGAIERLPELTIDGPPERTSEQAEQVLGATGTDGNGGESVAPNVTPARCNNSQESAQICQNGSEAESGEDTKKPQESRGILGNLRVVGAGIEPATPAFSVQCSTN